MHTNFTTRLKTISLVLAVAFAGLPTAALAQRSLLTEIAATRPGHGETRPEEPSEKERMMRSALEFLESPDSGVWAGPADTFENKTASLDPSSGRLVGRYERYHKGLRLLDSAVKIVVEPEGEASFTFEPGPFEPPADVAPTVPEARVWNIVADALRVDTEGLYGKIELALLPKDQGEALLVWYVRAKHPEAEATDFTIDARTGEVLEREKAYASASINVTGTGFKRPSGGSASPTEVELDTLWHNDDDEYFLVDHSRGGTQVLDMQDRIEENDFYGHTYSQMSSNEWGNGQDWEPGDSTTGPTGQTAAVEVMWGAQRTWDMLNNTLGLEGFDDKGEPMILRVHIRKDEKELYTDAHWDGDYANFGDLDVNNGWSRTDLDTVAHELGHGVWDRNVNDRNKGEARGLNEGHGDIAAALTRHYAYVADGTGSTIPTPAERGDLGLFNSRMVNPWSYSASDGSQGLAAYTNGMADKEEHTQGTAYGHMFAILSMGMPTLPEATAEPCHGNSYTCLQKSNFPLGMAGIGLDKAGRIWIKATTKYFPNKPTFADARTAWLQAADELYGNPSPEYAAVQNAWYLINVGEPAEDLFPPEIEALPLIVDNYEASVLVETSAVDDIGVVLMTASTPGSSRKAFGNSLKGYLDAPTLPGNHEVTIKAWDQDEKDSTTVLPYAYESSNRLFLSRFESSQYEDGDPLTADDDQWFSDNWTVSDGWLLVEDDPDGAFLGDGYIRFSSFQWIKREVVIPPAATQLHLGYRYRVKPGMALGSGQLRVEILDAANNLLETLTTITPGMDTSQDYSNNYLKDTLALAGDYAGQLIKVRIRSIDSEPDLFRIDQVFMYYDATPAVYLDVDVDEREGSVIMDANVAGIEKQLIDYVKFFVDGVEVDQDNYWPYQLIESTEGYAKDVVMTAEAIAYDHFGDPIAGSSAEDFEVQTVNQVLFNGDFETGDAYWSVNGDVAFCEYNPAGGQAHPAFIGTGCMTFDGTATLSRTVPIPGNALTASLSFRLDNDSPESSTFDLDVLLINNDTGLVIATLEEFIGIEANTDLGTSHKGYRKYVADLTPYKGMNFSVMFALSTSDPVTFHLDNVGAIYYTFDGGPGGDGPGGFQGN